MTANHDEIVFERTPQGQLFYDLAFTALSPKYLARKHGIPAPEIRRLREIARKPKGKYWPPKIRHK